MTTMNEGPTSGQVTDPSIPAPKNDPSELIAVLEKNTKAIVRIGAVLTKFGERLDALEATREEDAPVTERRAIGPVPRLALRSDATMLLEVNGDVAEEDLAGRIVARYVELTQAEAGDALDVASEGFTTAASKVVWTLARPRLGYPAKPKTEEP